MSLPHKSDDLLVLVAVSKFERLNYQHRQKYLNVQQLFATVPIHHNAYRTGQNLE